MRARRRGMTLTAALLALLVWHAGGSAATGGTKSGKKGSVPASRPTSDVGARKPRPSTKPPLQQARDALGLEQLAGYGQAADVLRELRRHVPADADLELGLALDEARSGQLDSAAALLWGSLLSDAVHDSLPTSRRHDYHWKREELLINGTFDGWHWYVARARAEVAARLGRWNDAREAARLCVAARRLVGKEWLVLAVCAGRAGDLEEAEAAARQAAFLDPSLPEAHYLQGLLSWRARRVAAAQTSFRAAVALDSSYRAPALALVRSRLPSAMPDTIPGEILTGARQIGLLTSPLGPKIEEFNQTDKPPHPLVDADPKISGGLPGNYIGAQLTIAILVDERGHIVLHDMPWIDPSDLPEGAVSAIAAVLPQYRFEPAQRFGAPRRAWTGLVLKINP